MILQPTQSQLVIPGAAVVSSIMASPWISTDLTWRLINDADGTVAIAESGDAITQVDTGEESPLVRYDRSFTAPSAGRYLAIWRHVLHEEAQTIVVEPSGSVAFATTGDIQTRLGRALGTAGSPSETDTAAYLLGTAATVIADAAGYDDGWAAALSPVPDRLRRLSVELACRVLLNPSQHSQIRQQVGSYSFAATIANGGTIQLSDAEVMMVRRAVHGRTTDSVHVDSGFEKAQDEYWLRQQQPVSSNAPGVTIA